MMKRIMFLLISIFLIGFACAGIGDIESKIEAGSSEVQSFFDSVPKDEIIVVKGSGISIEDKLLFNLIKSNYDGLSEVTIFSDKSSDLDKEGIVLIGSERTNLVTKEFVRTIEREKKDFSPLIIERYEKDGKKYMIIYSKKEVSNTYNYAAEKSFLSRFMDKRLVPVVATLLSLFLLYLWHILMNAGLDLFNETITSKFLDYKISKRKIKKNELLNKYEVFAFLVYVIVFAFTLAYSYAEGWHDVIYLFWINLAVVGIITLSREGFRLMFSHRNKIRSEFVLWPWGGLITIISTFLGNTFSLVSYTQLDEDEKDEKKFGKYAFFLSLVTVLVAVLAYIMNIFLPSIILQMTFVFSIMIVFIELFPLSPMPGKDVRMWNKLVWLFSYIIVFLLYVGMNFSMMV